MIRRDATHRLVTSLLRAAAVASLSVYVGWNLFWLAQGEVPPALFLGLTGWPAPTTGGTRSLRELGLGHWGASLRWNAMTLPLCAAPSADRRRAGAAGAPATAAVPGTLACLELAPGPQPRLGAETHWRSALLVNASQQMASSEHGFRDPRIPRDGRCHCSRLGGPQCAAPYPLAAQQTSPGP